MPRYIDRNALWVELSHIHFYNEADKATMEALVRSCPTVEAVGVVHAHWEPRADLRGFLTCSACRDCNVADDWVDGTKWRFCPNCGARMDEPREGAE